MSAIWAQIWRTLRLISVQLGLNFGALRAHLELAFRTHFEHILWSHFGLNFGAPWALFRCTDDSILAHLGLTLLAFRSHFECTLVTYLAHFGLTLVALWAHFDRMLGSILAHLGLNFGSLLSHVGRTLGSLWSHIGPTSVALWTNFGLTLGLLLYLHFSSFFGHILGLLYAHFGFL